MGKNVVHMYIIQVNSREVLNCGVNSRVAMKTLEHEVELLNTLLP